MSYSVWHYGLFFKINIGFPQYIVNIVISHNYVTNSFLIIKNIDKAQYADHNPVIIADKSLNVFIMERKKNILSEMGNKDK